MNFNFKKTTTLEERKLECQRVMQEHPNKVPIIVEKAPTTRIHEIDKTKYLVERSLSLPQFTASIRKKLDLDEKEGLFLLANGKISLSQNEIINSIYQKFKDKDGFLYIAYASEEIWG